MPIWFQLPNEWWPPILSAAEENLHRGTRYQNTGQKGCLEAEVGSERFVEVELVDIYGIH